MGLFCLCDGREGHKPYEYNVKPVTGVFGVESTLRETIISCQKESFFHRIAFNCSLSV